VGLQDAAGDSALHEAAANGHADVVRMLCAAPPAPDCVAPQLLQNRAGETALHRAASSGYHNAVKVLCASPGAAAALALQDKRGRSPLVCAVEEGHAAIAVVLRARGALHARR
jgi:ankyrin repeat protein